MSDPHLSVIFVHVIDVYKESHAGVEAASYVFAEEGSPKSPLVARWHGHEAGAGPNDGTL